MLFHDSVKSPKLQQVQCEMLVFALQSPSFWHQKSIPKMMFFQKAFLGTLAYDFMLILYQNGRFGEPFKIQWATKWHPNRPSCAKHLHLTSSPACLFSVLTLGCILITLWFTFGVFLAPAGSRFPLIADARKRTCNVGRKMKRTCWTEGFMQN